MMKLVEGMGPWWDFRAMEECLRGHRLLRINLSLLPDMTWDLASRITLIFSHEWDAADGLCSPLFLCHHKSSILF